MVVAGLPFMKQRTLMMKLGTLISGMFILAACTVNADEASVTLRKVTSEGASEEVGTVHFRDSQFGLMVTPDLEELNPGAHGVHVHDNPSCDPAPAHHGPAVPAGAAGGHLDPQGTGKHEGPYGAGHLGDLPNLIVENDGRAR